MSFDWRLFAFGSAFFAALTAIFGKVGVSEINSDLATFYRTVIILAVSALLVSVRQEWQAPGALSHKGLGFLILSGIATGLSWLCYFRALQIGELSKVAPVDKLSVVMAMAFGALFLHERLTAREGIGGFFIAAGALILAWR